MMDAILGAKSSLTLPLVMLFTSSLTLSAIVSDYWLSCLFGLRFGFGRWWCLGWAGAKQERAGRRAVYKVSRRRLTCELRRACGTWRVATADDVVLLTEGKAKVTGRPQTYYPRLPGRPPNLQAVTTC